MADRCNAEGRVVSAVHGLTTREPDPDFEIKLAEHLRVEYDHDALLALYSRFANGDGSFDTLIRRAIWRAFARRFGHGVHIGSNVGFKHLETFEIGDGVFIGAQSYMQGLSKSAQAKQISLLGLRYAASAWRFERTSEDMPAHYQNTVKQPLWQAFQSGATMPIGERQLRNILVG